MVRKAGHAGVFPAGNNHQQHCFLIRGIMNNTVDPIYSFSQRRTFPCAVSPSDLLILSGVWRNIDIILAFGLFVSKEMFKLSYLMKKKKRKRKENRVGSQNGYFLCRKEEKEDERKSKIGFYSLVFQVMI